MTTEIRFVFPMPSRDVVSDGLRLLTKALHDRKLAEADIALFGGAYGGGATFENGTFLLHPYCWCERADCRWCSEEACGCPEQGIVRYELDGRAVESWERENRRILGDLYDARDLTDDEHAEWERRIAARDRRLKTIYPARVHTCAPRGLMADRPEGETWQPRQSAPHFWHKPSGSRLWWYKYIGRDMEGELRAPWADILRGGLASIGVALSEDLCHALATEIAEDAVSFTRLIKHAVESAGATFKTT